MRVKVQTKKRGGGRMGWGVQQAKCRDTRRRRGGGGRSWGKRRVPHDGRPRPPRRGCCPPGRGGRMMARGSPRGRGNKLGWGRGGRLPPPPPPPTASRRCRCRLSASAHPDPPRQALPSARAHDLETATEAVSRRFCFSSLPPSTLLAAPPPSRKTERPSDRPHARPPKTGRPPPPYVCGGLATTATAAADGGLGTVARE